MHVNTASPKLRFEFDCCELDAQRVLELKNARRACRKIIDRSWPKQIAKQPHKAQWSGGIITAQLFTSGKPPVTLTVSAIPDTGKPSSQFVAQALAAGQ